MCRLCGFPLSPVLLGGLPRRQQYLREKSSLTWWAIPLAEFSGLKIWCVPPFLQIVWFLSPTFLQLPAYCTFFVRFIHKVFHLLLFVYFTVLFYVYGCPDCMYVCAICAYWVSMELDEIIKTPGTGYRWLRVAMRMTESNLGPLKEQLIFLAIETFL